LFGKPYFKLGQCLWLWAYLYQIGGMLAAKHIANIDAFGHVFLGVEGAAGAVKNFFDEVAHKYVSLGRVSNSITFFQYVEAEFTQRIGTTGDNYFVVHGMDKLPLDITENLACQYGEQGAAVGATHPDIIRAMFERTYASVPKEEWNFAYTAGLDIGPEQPRMNFADVQETANTAFVAYSKDYRPDLYPILQAAP
jgi:hypothetical protein